MVLLPVAFGIAVIALLAILRRQRHQRESGLSAPRPLYVTLILSLFGLLAVVYVTTYVVSTLTRP